MSSASEPLVIANKVIYLAAPDGYLDVTHKDQLIDNLLLRDQKMGVGFVDISPNVLRFYVSKENFRAISKDDSNVDIMIKAGTILYLNRLTKFDRFDYNKDEFKILKETVLQANRDIISEFEKQGFNVYDLGPIFDSENAFIMFRVLDFGIYNEGYSIVIATGFLQVKGKRLALVAYQVNHSDFISKSLDDVIVKVDEWIGKIQWENRTNILN